MKSNNYIIQKIDDLVRAFPELKIRYEFDSFSDSHIIEVLPAKEYKDNTKYAKYETQLMFDFISEYPLEEIVFITEEDLVEIENPIYVKEGTLYGDININELFDISFDLNNLKNTIKGSITGDIKVKEIEQEDYKIEEISYSYALAA